MESLFIALATESSSAYRIGETRLSLYTQSICQTKGRINHDWDYLCGLYGGVKPTTYSISSTSLKRLAPNRLSISRMSVSTSMRNSTPINVGCNYMFFSPFAASKCLLESTCRAMCRSLESHAIICKVNIWLVTLSQITLLVNPSLTL